MKVTAIVRRAGGWWAVEVPELPGLYTQAKRLDQVADMVTDAAAMLGHDDVTVTVDIALPDDERAIVEDAKAKRARLAHAETEAAAASRAAVARLRDDGLTVRDVATVMGITPQRASQLLAS